MSTEDLKGLKRNLGIKIYQDYFPGIQPGRNIHCPFHNDKNPSFGIYEKDGAFRWKCFAGCGGEDMIDLIEKMEGVSNADAIKLLKKRVNVNSGIFKTLPKKVSTFEYKDKDGRTLYIKERFEPGRNGRDKGFFFRHKEKGQWVKGRGCDPLLYNLPEIIKFKNIIFTEGEGKANLLNKWGFTATCLDSGANSPWKDEYTEIFKGKESVVVLPDNDLSGNSYASMISNALNGRVGTIKVVELPGLRDGEDIVDWVNTDGNTREKLVELIEATPEWIPSGTKPLISSLLKWNDILSLDVHVEYVLENIIPKGSITLLFGRGGIGKTSLSLQIAHAVAEGRTFCNLKTIKAPVYYIDFENPLAVLKERVEKIGKAENLYIWHISCDPMPPKLDKLDWELYKQLPPGLIIFDTLRAANLADENDSKPIALIMTRLKELRELGFTIVLLHHTPKGNENIFKGSTAILDLTDHVLGLEEVKGTGTIEFDLENLYQFGTRKKTRYDPYSMYLTFNPDKKGFDAAENPNITKLNDIQEVLNKCANPLNQTEFKKLIKDKFGYPEHETRRLIKKGEGTHWKKQKSDGGRNEYQFVSLSAPYISDKLTNRKYCLDKQDNKNLTQPFKDEQFVSLSKGGCQTDKQVIDLNQDDWEFI